MLTSEATRKIEENVITDVNANVPAPSSTKARVLSPEAALLFDKGLVARPLMTPEVCSIHIKNTGYRYRWVNRSSQAGRVYQMRKSQGFINATRDDAEVLSGDAVADSGEITAGDLILMKIQASLYDAAIKHNIERALASQRTRGMYFEGASSDPFDDTTPKRASVAQEPFNRSGQAKAFIPENPDALVEDSISSGRVKKSREAVEEIREHIKADKSARS